MREYWQLFNIDHSTSKLLYISTTTRRPVPTKTPAGKEAGSDGVQNGVEKPGEGVWRGAGGKRKITGRG